MKLTIVMKTQSPLLLDTINMTLMLVDCPPALHPRRTLYVVKQFQRGELLRDA
jgi:hypothetical protein